MLAQDKPGASIPISVFNGGSSSVVVKPVDVRLDRNEQARAAFQLLAKQAKNDNYLRRNKRLKFKDDGLERKNILDISSLPSEYTLLPGEEGVIGTVHCTSYGGTNLVFKVSNDINSEILRIGVPATMTSVTGTVLVPRPSDLVLVRGYSASTTKSPRVLSSFPFALTVDDIQVTTAGQLDVAFDK